MFHSYDRETEIDNTYPTSHINEELIIDCLNTHKVAFDNLNLTAESYTYNQSFDVDPAAVYVITTQNASDGWFIGVTHNLVSGAWVGGDDRSIHFRNWVLGQGARTAMPIWQQYMMDVYADDNLNIDKGKFDEPIKKINVEIDCSVYNNEIKSDSLDIIIDKIDASDIY